MVRPKTFRLRPKKAAKRKNPPRRKIPRVSKLKRSAVVRPRNNWSAFPVNPTRGLVRLGVPETQLFSESMVVELSAQQSAVRTGVSEILVSNFPRMKALTALYAQKALVNMRVTLVPYSGLSHGGTLGLFLDPAYDTDAWVRSASAWLANYGAGMHRNAATILLSRPEQFTLPFALPSTAKLPNASEDEHFGESRLGIKWITYGYEDSSDAVVPVGNLVITMTFRLSTVKPLLSAVAAPMIGAGEQQ